MAIFKNVSLDQILKTLILGFFGLGIFMWLYFDTTVPFWDEAHHINKVLGLSVLMRDIPHNLFAIISKLTGFYPPLYYLIAVPFNWIASKVWLIRFSNILYFFLLAFVILKLSEKIPQRFAGVVSLFLVLCIPEITLWQRLFFLDLPATTFTLLLMYMLFYRDNFFHHFPNAILFGIVLGLGLLTKYTVMFFLTVPLLYQFISSFKVEAGAKLTVLRNYFVSLLLGLLVAFPWYFLARKSLVRLFEVNNEGYYAPGGSTFDLASLGFYFQVITDNLTWPLLITCLIGIYIAICAKNHPYQKLLYFFILPGWIIIQLVESKDIRYALPILATLPLFATQALYSLRRSWLRTISIAALLLASFTGYLTSMFFSSPAATKYLFPTCITKQMFLLNPDANERESIVAVFNAVQADSKGHISKLFIVADAPPVEFSALQNVYWMENGRDIQLIPASHRRPEPEQVLVEEIKTMDYILSVNGPSPKWFSVQYVDQITAMLPKLLANNILIKIGDYPITDRAMTLYRVVRTGSDTL